MKLRNLLFGTMIACAFVACSNDDDPTPNSTPEGKGDAKLVVAVKKNLQTRAGENETQTDNEKKITDLTVVVYDATGAYITNSSTLVNLDGEAMSSNNEVEVEGLTAGRSVKLLVVANVGKIDFSTTNANSFTSPEILIPAADGFSDGYLPMSSGLTQAFTLKEGNNYYGYNDVATISEADGNLKTAPVPLIRNVARVDLVSLTFDMKKATGIVYTSGTATFTPENAFIMHGRSKSKVADVNSSAWYSSTIPTWGSVVANYTVANIADYVSGTSGFTNSTGSTVKNYLKTLSKDGKKTQDISQSNSAQVITLAEGLKFYIFENDQITGADADNIKTGKMATKLVIQGKFSLTNGVTGNKTQSIEEKTSYWPITIGAGSVTGLAADGIHRNVIYEITATLAGQGLDDPTTPDEEKFADLFVRTKVVDWGKASQDSVVE
ncbi:fimbrial protein [uncultured Parabacteroides sp.]|uniref:fimbrial protein n=1 Tax=uncultured Parabacteroides sp. TaxID=512312 RepID=UPI00259360D4|nr:fimbrial protein [uncultured Parabacteroides sp.]